MTPDAMLLHAEGLLARRSVPEALALLDEAEAAGADPDRCCGDRWQAAMLMGQFGLAWQQSDRLRARHAPDPHRLWTGEPLAGRRLMVRCLHGLGDTVQMLAYAPRLRALAASVVYQVPPAMLSLARCFEGVDSVMTWGEQAPAGEPAWDLQLESVELPYIFRTSIADLPIATRYLTHAPTPAGGRPRMGLVWAAGEWDPGRSLPVTWMAALASAHPRIDFVSLQGGSAAGEWKAGTVPAATLPQLAGAIAGLDLVLTVDTLAAHLAGALGTPAWVLLQHAADWRWMLARTDSPWYPTLRLFRQPAPGDWGAVRQAIDRALTEAF